LDTRHYVWECDYGEHSRYIDVLKVLIVEQNAGEMSMCALLVNNNPYNLEFFIVLGYDTPSDGQVEKMQSLMANIGARNRPDIPLKNLFEELSGHRYNAMELGGLSDVELAVSQLFEFKDRSEIAKVISMKPLGKSVPVFLSHASVDKPFVEDIIPYLTKRGLPVWYDKISIDYGESILSAVQSGVQISGAVLFFLTPAFLNSNWCKREMEGFLLRYAGGQNILILTLLAHNILHEDLPFFLQGIKYLRLSEQPRPDDISKEILPVLSKHFNI
jgi:TIR domain